MRVYFHTFGCKANQYDTEMVRQAFADHGAIAVDDPASADLAVLTSCTVTATGEAKLRGLARRLARARVETVVMGCAGAVDDGAIAAVPGVRAVIGGADVPAVLRAAGLPTYSLSPGVRRFPASARAWLKIQDGCDEHCTFCATTLARGANRSRAPGGLVDEAQRLAERHPEIVLTGVHIGTWGRDIGSPLSALVARLMHEVPGVRFRLSSVEASEVDDRLAALFAEPARLAPHLHAPLQSASDRVLKRMGRHTGTRGRRTPPRSSGLRLAGRSSGSAPT